MLVKKLNKLEPTERQQEKLHTLKCFLVILYLQLRQDIIVYLT